MKKGDSKEKSNYRPISILPVTSKILEETVRQQVSRYFEKNNLFPKHQHGFRPKRSTTTALIAIQDYLLGNKKEGKNTAMLLWDLSAAFDTLDHNIFIEKLRLYGFDESSLSWFSSYLTNRRQSVQIGSAASGEKELTLGSPQGAVLSPLIFTIYVADIELWMEFADIFGYADDTTTAVSDENMETACNKLQKESKNVLNFMNSNGLAANPDKTGLLIFRSGAEHKEKICLSIGDTTVSESNEEKLLGLTIQNNLQWKSHINQLQSSLNQRVALLRRLKQWLPIGSLGQIAQGLILSKIRYGLSVFGQPRLEETDPLTNQCQPLQTIVNNVMRLISGKKLSDRVPIRDLHACTGIPSVNQMTVQAMLMEAWKMMHGHSGLKMFEKVDGVTRAASAGDVKIPKSVGNKINGYAYYASKIWNNTDAEIRNIENLTSVKPKIKRYAAGFQ